jgi:AcrR family transcriptional regulator
VNTETNSPHPPADARDRLLSAALDQFTLRGYAATSVRELCEAAGVTKPVLYYYFKSKEGLYLQLMEESYSHFEAMLADLTGIQGNIRERLTGFCAGLFAVYTAQLPLVKLCYSIYYGTPQGAPYFNLSQYYDRLLHVVSSLVEEGVESGEIGNENVADSAWAIMGCLNIAIEEQLCHGSNPRIDQASMLRMIELVFTGITSNKS